MNNAEAYMQDSIRAYGRDMAFELNSAIITAFNESQQRLPLLKPVSGIIPVVIKNPIEPPRGSGFAFANGSIILYFHEDHDPTLITSNIPSIVEHEVAHVAHRQHNPRFHLKNDQLLFAGTIVEGIAVHAEHLLDPDYDVMQVALSEPSEAELVVNGLIDVLYNPGDDQAASYYDFLFGNDEFYLGGYKIGHFVVASYVAHTGDDLEALMKIHVAEFREFAETMI